jgi:hypothetical protein
MIELALLLAITESVITVPPSHWTAIALNTTQNSTTAHVSFDVRNGASRIQAMVLALEEAERLNRGRSIQPLYSSGFKSSDSFRVLIPDAGRYVLVLDNRLEGRFPTEVSFRLEMTNPDDIRVRTVSADRRRATVALSLLFFGAIAVFSAVKFLRP